MSSEALGHAWRHSPHKGPTFLVLIAIADIVNDANDNEFWMSTENLAKKTRLARSTISDSLKEIEESGWIERVESLPGRSVRYRFVLDFEREMVWNSVRVSASRTGNKPDTSPRGGQGVSVRRTGGVRNTDTILKETTKETKAAVFELTKLYFDNLKGDIKPSGDVIAGQISRALKNLSVERLAVLIRLVAANGVPVTSGTLMVAQKTLDQENGIRETAPTPTPDYYDPSEHETAKAKAVPMPDYVRNALRK